MLDEVSQRFLAVKAKYASDLAHVPNSGYRVGAAIMMNDGNIFVGCNVETGCTLCTLHAEMCAIGYMIINNGDPSRAKAMAVYTDEEIPWLCCGPCRQAVYELFPEDFKIITCNDNGVHKVFTQEEMLPDGYCRRSRK